jgi:hypothetical protein
VRLSTLNWETEESQFHFHDFTPTGSRLSAYEG